MNGGSTNETESHRALSAVERRIADACLACGRDPGSVRLLAVSKTFGAERVLEMAACGQLAFGENYVSEALAKIESCSKDWTGPRLEWHFIGPVQSNKTRPIACHFDWVHSVGREKIGRRLSDARAELANSETAPLNVCIEVNVSDEPTKHGCAISEVPALADTLAALPMLRLRGLMAIPAPTEDMSAQRASFEKLRHCQEALVERGHSLDTLSMGMSADLEAAIAEGATIVRVGTALFGKR
ncbi:MAG: YggS family pyridoxal phosphate-dependent enzyme [Burkholderiaceae bacterium]